MDLTRLYRYRSGDAACVFEVRAATLVEADEAFELAMGFKPYDSQYVVTICGL